MKNLAFSLTALILFATPALAATAEIGMPAPDFTGTDVLNNKPFKLSDLKGKMIVLEWTNHLCPFVRKQYDGGAMQKTQAEVEKQGVEWVSIVSSAPGREGNVTPDKAVAIVKTVLATPNFKILDESGEIGKLSNAKATPTMIVINKDGNVAYMGAIDDKPTPDPASLQGADNYVIDAVNALIAGQPVKTPLTQAYGCAVKYAN